jgi:bacterioferritin-associated ferredoxin
MIVCLCRAVCDRTIKTAITAGATSVDAVGKACRAGTGCGACQETIAEMIADTGCSGGDCPRQSFTVTSPYLTVGEQA